LKFAPSFAAPPREMIVALELRLPGLARMFVERADLALAGLDVTATSWWRSQARNDDVGGAQLSQHLLGLAIDLVGPDEAEAERRLRAAGFVVIRHAVPGGKLHVHAQALPAGIIKAVFQR
jgi:hypothetical protein